MRWVALVFGLLIVAACAKEAPPPTPVVPTPEPVALPEPETDSAPDADREAKLDALRKQIRDLRDEIQRRNEESENLYHRHREEFDKLGDLSGLRAESRRRTSEANRARNQLSYYRKKMGPVDPAVEALAKEAERREGVIDKREDALADLQREAARTLLRPELHETPAAKDLRCIRAIRERWLEATIELRAGKPSIRQRKLVREEMRAWIDDDANRKRVAARAVALDPKARSTLGGYDYSRDLFFVLCQMLEDELDRANVLIELDRLAEMRAKIDALTARVDEAEEDRRRLEDDPIWPKVESTAVLRNKIHLLELVAANAEAALAETEKALAPAREMNARHDAEIKVNHDALERAKKELVRVNLAFEELAGR